LLSATLYRFVGKVKVHLAAFRCLLGAFETEQQRTWNHIPNRKCMWETQKNTSVFFIVAMRIACRATNQSSHGELSFHHNPHLRLRWGLCLFTLRVIRSGGTRLKHAAHLTYCHCCELCALKQKPGALLQKELLASASAPIE
jgi:hypothetical protein